MNFNEAWIAMFRRIPAELHDALALGMNTGGEIVIQKIVKLEPDFMIVRGRLAGTTDTGRVVMISYTQLTYLAIMREMKDPEVEAIFSKGAEAPVIDLPAAPSEPAAAAPPEAATVDEKTPAVNEVKKSAQVSRSDLVARMRDRLKEPRK